MKNESVLLLFFKNALPKFLGILHQKRGSFGKVRDFFLPSKELGPGYPFTGNSKSLRES